MYGSVLTATSITPLASAAGMSGNGMVTNCTSAAERPSSRRMRSTMNSLATPRALTAIWRPRRSRTPRMVPPSNRSLRTTIVLAASPWGSFCWVEPMILMSSPRWKPLNSEAPEPVPACRLPAPTWVMISEPAVSSSSDSSMPCSRK